MVKEKSDEVNEVLDSAKEFFQTLEVVCEALKEVNSAGKKLFETIEKTKN